VTRVEWESKDGKSGVHTESHRIVAWQDLAEECSNMLRKGSQIYLEGKLQTRSWEDDQGIKKYITEIVAHDIRPLGDTNNQVVKQEEPPVPEDDDIPF
jgi:single-strand DNA-binding protein